MVVAGTLVVNRSIHFKSTKVVDMPKRKKFCSKSKCTSNSAPSVGAYDNTSHAQEQDEPRSTFPEQGHHLTAENMPEGQDGQSTQQDEAFPFNESEDFPFHDEPNAESVPLTGCSKNSKYWTVDLIDENKSVKKGKLSLADLWVLEPGTKVIVEWNESNQPIGESGGLLATFLGVVARNFSNFPICYERWPLVPKLYKDNTYKDTIQGKFDVNAEKHKDYILQNLGRKWRDNRCRLFSTCYDFDKTRDQNLESCPDGIELDHWASFIDYRLKSKTLAMCDKNVENRQKQTVPHTLGSKSMARKKHELEVTNNRAYTRSQMYPICHKKKDGSYVNDEAREKSEQLVVLESKGTCSQNASHDDPFSKLFGKEHPGRVRGMGFGVCPSQVQNSSSSHCGGAMSCSHSLDFAKLQ